MVSRVHEHDLSGFVLKSFGRKIDLTIAQTLVLMAEFSGKFCYSLLRQLLTMPTDTTRRSAQLWSFV